MGALAGREAQRRRGRPAIYLDDADRQAAHRDRRETQASADALTAARVKRPSAAFVKELMDRFIRQAGDPVAARADLAAYLAALEAPIS